MSSHLVLARVLGTVGLINGPRVGIVVDLAGERETPVLEHRCQRCSASLGSASLVPVASWFRRCPTDPTHPRWRYPVTDLALAACFAFMGARFGASWILVPYLLLFVSFVAMSIIDLEHKLLLNILTYPTLGAALFGVLVLSGPNDHADGIYPALIGALTYLGILGLAFIVYPPGLGLGDVKLAPTLGLAMGWVAADSLTAVMMVLYALLVGFFTLGVLGVLYGKVMGKGLKVELPAGPFLVLGALVLIVYSDPSLSAIGAPLA
ncbi:MAG: A24 family peptidase [Acidimicrobiales bacterium]